jgi:type II secretory pathway predicted ATPase ExeA
MYEAFYGFKERPFALVPDPSFLYLSKGHSTALTLLRYSIMNRQGFTVVSGEVGSGKTTLVNRLLDEMKTGDRRFDQLHHAHLRRHGRS